eukprot:3055678-Prymnesium_polylepis.1
MPCTATAGASSLLEPGCRVRLSSDEDSDRPDLAGKEGVVVGENGSRILVQVDGVATLVDPASLVDPAKPVLHTLSNPAPVGAEDGTRDGDGEGVTSTGE